ncbi:MAG: hypothetical protein UD936_01300 [Acutalibacteraceae bacterium]|nr:hypothetical protein [Acutalibacteraceae bacterium]
MKRVPLNQGDKINLNNREYTIDTVIGDGATCIVYSAYYEDNLGLPHRVNIKECYPYNADVIREGETLVWMSENERIQKQLSFTTTYKKLMNNQKGNYIVHAFDIGRCNETLYIVMDANDGVTFDNDNANNLSDILTTVKLLAYVVGEYHKNGYLHLDIKPSNFLVYPRPSDHIILFDMDTITPIEDIKSGKVQVCSYSDDWAAPEQKQGKINKLCPTTDIYAIGAVLFEKVMGRQVECGDSCLFAEWEFDGELFEDVNPKIKRLLGNIFRKTISANIKCRYQSANDLIKALTEAIKVANSDVYLKGDDICCSGCFFGRENELNLIKSYFDSKKKAVFLHGFGGIGKTEITRRYAQLNSKKYDNVLFIKYNGNDTLQELLNDIDIVNFDTDDSKEKWRKLRNLLDEHTLVIVDNFDIKLGADNGLKSLFETKANILVATRTDFSSVYNGDKYGYIEVKELANSELEQMFITNAKITSITVEDRCILKKIFKLIENHTYATELLAKQMWYSGWYVEELYQKVKSGFTSLENAERIIVNKDEDVVKDHSLSILRAVFSITNLSEAQKQVLQNISLLSFVKLNKSIYKDLIAIETLDPLNELIEIGLIQKNGEFLSLHRLVIDLINLELNPCWDNCIELYNYIYQQVEKFAEYEHIVYFADEEEAEHTGRFLYYFFKNNDLTLPENKKLAIQWLNKLVHMDPILWFPFEISQDKQNKFESFLNDLINIMDDTENSIGVNYILCIISLEKCEKIPANQKKYSFKNKCLENKITSHFNAVKELSKQESNGKEVLNSLGNMIFKSVHIKKRLVPLGVVHKYYNFFSSYNQFTMEEKHFYNIPLNTEDLECQSLDRFIRKSEYYQTCISRQSELNELLEEFMATSYKYDLALKIANDPQYKKQRKIEIIKAFLNTVFNPLFGCFCKDKAATYIAQIDWTEINLIIDLITDIFSDIISPSWEEQRILKFSYDEDSYNDEYEPYWDEFDIEDDEEEMDAYWNDENYFASDTTIVYKAIISLIEGANNFPELMSKIDKYNTETRQDDNDFSKGLYQIMHISYLTGKCWLIVPYMYQAMMDLLPDSIEKEYLIDLRAYYPMIKQVADYSEVAKEEMKENSQLSDNFAEIHNFAENLANIITNKTFDLTDNFEE